MSKQKYYSLLEAGFTSAYLEEEPMRIGERVATRCPRCSDSRTNKKQKCAQVTKVEGGWNWYCHQCEAGKGEFISELTKEQELDAWKRNNPQSPKNAQNSAYKTQSNTNTKQMQDSLENAQNSAPKVKPAKVAMVSKYSQAFLAAWEARGISEQTLRLLGTNEVQYYISKLGASVNCSQFPIIRKGELIAYKYRAVDTKDFAISKDSELGFYNFDWIEQANKRNETIASVILVEGEIDLATFVQCGYTNVISVPNGGGNASYMDKYFTEKAFKNVKQFILATDNDAIGLKLREEFARRVGKSKCRILQYRQHPTEQRECKDPNEMYMLFGVEPFRNLDLRSYAIEGVHTLNDVRDKLDALREEGYEPYMKIGIPSIDSLFTWSLGAQLSILSAPPNSAKTDVILNVAMRLAVLHDAKIGIMSPESGEAADIYAALIVLYLGKHFVRKPFGAPAGSMIEVATDAEANEAREFIGKHFFCYSCEAPSINTDDFMRIGSDLVESYGVNMLICDPYNFLSDAFTPEHGDAMMSNYLNGNLQKIKHFSYERNVHTVLIPHPKQMQPVQRMLDFGDINGGAAWGNKIDNILFVNRLYAKAIPNYPKEVQELATKSTADAHDADLGDHIEFIVRKVKKRWAGKRGETSIAYQLTTGRIGIADATEPAVFHDAKALRLASAAIENNGDELPDFASFGEKQPSVDLSYKPTQYADDDLPF
jgi:twinkle protein